MEKDERCRFAALLSFFFYRESCCLPPAGGRSLLLLQDDVLSEDGRGFSLDGERTFSRVCDRLRVRRFAFQKRNITHLKMFPPAACSGDFEFCFCFFFLFLLLRERRTLCEGKNSHCSKVFFKSVEMSQALVFSHASTSGRGSNQREQKHSL